MPNSFSYRGVDVEWLNHHAAFYVESSKKKSPKSTVLLGTNRSEADGLTLVIDPWEIDGRFSKGNEADILLLTHSHHDHFNIEDIRKVLKKETKIIAPADCIEGMKQAGIDAETICAERGKKIEVGITVLPVPAYNINKQFHPDRNRWVGYVVSLGDVRLYFAGDTDFIPEMKTIGKIDIAFLPCGGTYTMDGEEAGKAAEAIKPKIAVPMHWGKICGSRNDAESVKRAFSGETNILE